MFQNTKYNGTAFCPYDSCNIHANWLMLKDFLQQKQNFPSENFHFSNFGRRQNVEKISDDNQNLHHG